MEPKLKAVEDHSRFSKQHESPEPLVPRKRTSTIAFLLALFACVGGLSYYWFSYLERFVSTDDAYIESDLYSVNSRIMGYVKETPVHEGMFVKKGEVLAAMDSNDLEFERHAKQMKLDKATVDMKRAQTLNKSKAISDFDLENADAAVKAAEVDLQGTEIKLRYTQISSPSDGYVAKKSVASGQFVQPGQTLFVVVDPQHPWIKANFKETQTLPIRAGMPVSISVDGYPGRTFRGHVESVYPSTGSKLSILPAENASGNFTRIVQRVPVRISIEDSDPTLQLRPGMSAKVEIDVRSAHR